MAKLRHASLPRPLVTGGGERFDVEEESNFCWAGVERALRFWLMVSSIVPREARKKSREKHQVYMEERGRKRAGGAAPVCGNQSPDHTAISHLSRPL